MAGITCASLARVHADDHLRYPRVSSTFSHVTPFRPSGPYAQEALVHNRDHVTPGHYETSLSPGSTPHIHDLLLFGIGWAWLLLGGLSLSIK
jgi:hypothetical protein